MAQEESKPFFSGAPEQLAQDPEPAPASAPFFSGAASEPSGPSVPDGSTTLEAIATEADVITIESLATAVDDCKAELEWIRGKVRVARSTA